MTIFFDMDGTLGELYAVSQWLEKLRAFDPSPYAEAAVMHNMSLLARYLNKLRARGHQLGIISWLSMESNPEYDKAVTAAKLQWLATHLPSVQWDIVHIVAYGVPKESFITGEDDVLFDDTPAIRERWTGQAYEPDRIIEILKSLLAQ